MIHRLLAEKISKRLFKGKAILLFGPRQVGKSTLIEMLFKDMKSDYLCLNGDEADVRDMLSSTTSAKLRSIVGKHKIVFIDEAQRIENIGITLKLFTDSLKGVQVIASGSSAFELSGHVREPLTGRKYEYNLYPLCFAEMAAYHGLVKEKRLLEQRMLYGYYPEVVSSYGDEKELLKLLANSYLYKDLLMIEQIKKPVLLEKILKALALQIGSEVSYQELGQLVGADKGTVEKYIDLLEKAYVVFRIPALNRNVRNEIRKGKKVYFFDCGIRNAVINNFNPLSTRTDTGALWENFVIAERMKYLQYHDLDAGMYFWRSTQQQEVDLIEEYSKSFKAFECKWNVKGKVRFPLTFTQAYKTSELSVISPKNLDEYLL